MTETLGAFADGLASIRRALANTDDQLRVIGFMNACDEVAGYVSHGLDRALAADQLVDMALANGLDDGDAVQFIIGKAFGKIDPPDLVPDDIDERPQANGHDPYPPKLLPAASRYVFPDPAAMTPRQWLYAGHYVRGAVTATVAPGGYGKTTLTLYELITMALEGKRVWYISGEDPKAEIDRRIAAHCQHHSTDTAQLAQNLFVDDKTSFPLFIGKSPRSAAVAFDEAWLAHLENQIRANRIDVVALDPFISFHSVPEGDNGAVDQIVKRLALIAQVTNSNIELSHHVRKAMQGMHVDFTIDDSRGGSAIINAVRSARVFNRMSADEAALAKVKTDNRSSYVRIDKGKRNMAPAEKATWWHIASVLLPNGDNVQAIEPYKFPEAFDSMSTHEVDWVQTYLRKHGPCRASSQSADWLGHRLGEHCGREDMNERGGAIWANKIISTWLTNRVFKRIDLRDAGSRKKVPHYADNDFVDPDEQRGKVLPFQKTSLRFRVLDDCEAQTVCLSCQEAGNVKRIKDTSKTGSKSETLHEGCAAAWFDRSDRSRLD